MLFISLTVNSIANDVIEHKKLPLEVSLPHLQTIEDMALRLGNGPVKVYVFVDPLCPHSRNFLSLIYESKKMQERYSYYLFLYTLPRFHSEKIVAGIYQSETPLKQLIEIMLHGKTIKINKNIKVASKIHKIAQVAETIDVYKRPYLVMVKSKKKKKEQ